MKRINLKNGVKILLENKKTDSISIFVTIRTGSINEEDHNRGISHFLEHMVFEGTKNRTALEIANAIESLGGTIGAYTSAERTCYYVKLLKKHAKVGIDILQDIMLNPLFEDKVIEKERTVILSELKMKKDEPRFYQWSLFSRSLFREFPLKHPVIGYTKTVEAINRDDLFEYFNKRYIGPNMIVSVVGDTKNIENQLLKAFQKISGGPDKIPRFKKEPIKKTKRIIHEKKPIKQTYMVLGYIAPDRRDKDSYVFDVIHAILGRGISGRLFDELRTKRGLGYDVGSHYSDNRNFGFFATYATVDKKNLNLTKRLIINHIQDVDKITNTELQDAKNFIEGEFKLHNEDTENLADTLGFYEHIGDAKLLKDYIKNIKKVTSRDIARVKRKYMKKNNYTMVILDQS